MTTHPVDDVLKMVREELQRPSSPSTAALYSRAIRIDPSIRELTLRQFNAKYPLRVKREKARTRAKEDGKRTRKRVDREAIRDVLFRFARNVAAAGGTAGVIDALAGVDRYVEEVVAAIGS